jgi:hypothetical protein
MQRVVVKAGPLQDVGSSLITNAYETSSQLRVGVGVTEPSGTAAAQSKGDHDIIDPVRAAQPWRTPDSRGRCAKIGEPPLRADQFPDARVERRSVRVDGPVRLDASQAAITPERKPRVRRYTVRADKLMAAGRADRHGPYRTLLAARVRELPQECNTKTTGSAGNRGIEVLMETESHCV